MKPAHKTLLLWVLLIFMFIAIWQFLSPDRPSVAPAPRAPMGNGPWIMGGLVVAVVALVVWFRRDQRGVSAGVARLNAANDHFAAGRVDAAEAELEGLDKQPAPRLVHLIGLMRAAISFRRGEREAALARADEALRARRGVLSRRFTRGAALQLTAFRAVLRASLEDADGARADIAAVQAHDWPLSVEAYARIALAEAMLLERAGDRAALKTHLDRTRTLLREATPTWERAIALAYLRMADGGGGSVYRRPAAEGSTDAELAAWVARIAPSAAPFVRARRKPTESGASAIREEPASSEARRSVEAVRNRSAGGGGSRTRKTIALWLALVAFFAGVWVVSSYGGGELVGSLLPVMIGGPLVAWIVWLVRRGRAESAALWGAARMMATGDLAAATELLGRLRQLSGERGANACLLRAEIAYRKGELEAALAQIDVGLARLGDAERERERGQSKVVARTAADRAQGATLPALLYRELGALRAIVLAASGEDDEARAELELLPEGTGALATYRVRLLTLVQQGALRDAEALLDARGDEERSNVRDDALATLVRSAVHRGSARDPELDVLRNELRHDPHLGAWLASVAPELLRRVDVGGRAGIVLAAARA